MATSAGTSGNDTYLGTVDDDKYDGLSGDDVIFGRAGNDLIDGGSGTDTAIYTGKSVEYIVIFDARTSTYRVKDTVVNRDGTDKLTAIELLQFSDGIKQLATTDALLVSRVSQALFGKALGSVSFNDFLSKVGPTGNALEWVKSQASAVSSLSDASYATLVLNNIGITKTSLFATPTFGSPQQAYDALHAAMTGYLGLVGNSSRGVVAAQLANIIAGFEGETVYGVYGGAAKAFNQQIGSNIAHSINSANTTDIAVVPVVADGTSTASIGNFSYMLALGNYSYQISGFGVGDKLVGPTDNVPSIINSSFTDGNVTIEYAANGQTLQITLTGLTNEQDGSLFFAGDFNTVFGVGAFG